MKLCCKSHIDSNNYDLSTGVLSHTYYTCTYTCTSIPRFERYEYTSCVTRSSNNIELSNRYQSFNDVIRR